MSTPNNGIPQEGRWSRWGKQGFQKSITISDWISPYANAVSAKVGGERFWPQSNDMVLELEKCERILRAFTVEGVAQKEVKQEKVQDAKGSWIQKKVRVMRKIPPAAIRNAKGIAIFSSMRSGIAPFGGGGGSGVVMARLPSGGWSAPSAVTPQNASAGLLLGVDFLDCILLINSDKALKSFMSHRVDIGAETGLTAGPYGSGMSAEAGLDRAPIYSYVRTRGAYAGVELMGQIFFHRFDENERFYYAPHISAKDILTGKVRIPPTVYPLHRALRDAESGRAQGGRLERTEYDLIKIPESEVFSQLGPNASSKKKKRFAAGGELTPGSEPSAAPSPGAGKEGQSSRTSLESLQPEETQNGAAIGVAAGENGTAEGIALGPYSIDDGGANGAPAITLSDEDGDDSDDIVHDGERLRLPPTPAELEMMEAAGLKDDEDLRQEAEERKQIYEMPPPPMHVNVKKYWHIHPTLAMKRPTKQLVMDGPHLPQVREAQYVPLPDTPPMGTLSVSSNAADNVPKEATLGESNVKESDIVASGLTEEQADETMQAAAAGADVDELREQATPKAKNVPHLPSSDEDNESRGLSFEHSSDSQLTVESLPGATFEDAEDHQAEDAERVEHDAEAEVATGSTLDDTVTAEEEHKPQRPPRRKR